MSNADKELENFLSEFFSLLFNAIKGIFKDLFKGIKKLNKKTTIIPFICLLFLSTAIFIFHDKYILLPFEETVNKGVFLLLFTLPFFYLLIIGGTTNKDAEKYNQKFSSIRFCGKDGKYPIFWGIKTDGKKQYLTFKTNIPLSVWKKNKEYLESAFDCNILKIQNATSKNLITLTTVPSDCIIPEFIAWKNEYRSKKDGEIVIGVSALSSISFDLNKNPHILIAGETGSGKSVIIRNCLWQMVLHASKVIMIDFKGGVEFGKQYEQFGEVITKRERALEIFDLLVQENEARLNLFRELDVKNIQEHNKKTGKNLCRIGVFCDEIAEMLDKKGSSKNDKILFEKLEGKISTLARLSRATGIHLFLGTQRPDANVITGQIKTNIPLRVAGRFADKAASEIVLGATDAADLPDIKGRFLFKLGFEITEFQSFFFNDEVLQAVNIRIGDVLTEGLNNQPISTYHTTKPTQAEPRSRPNNASVSYSQPTASTLPDIDTESADWEAQLREMDAYDLNLDFGK